MGQGMCHLHCLIILSLVQNHFGYGGILGGPNVAIGYLFNWGMSVPLVLSTGGCHGHGLLCLISTHPSSTYPIHPDRSQPFLHSSQILTSHQEWLGLCVPQFALSHLPPPSHPPTQSTPTGLSHSFTCIKSSPCINPCHGWICPHLHPTPCLLTLPHNPRTMLWLSGFRDYAIAGLGAHRI